MLRPLCDLQGVLSNGQALSGVMADGPADVAAMWSVREGIAESCGKRGECLALTAVQAYVWGPAHNCRLFQHLRHCSRYVMQSSVKPPTVFWPQPALSGINSCPAVGAVFKYDVSVPQQSMYALVEHVREHVTKRCGDEIVGVVNYGHVGDGACLHSALAHASADLCREFAGDNEGLFPAGKPLHAVGGDARPLVLQN